MAAGEISFEEASGAKTASAAATPGSLASTSKAPAGEVSFEEASGGQAPQRNFGDVLKSNVATAAAVGDFVWGFFPMAEGVGRDLGVRMYGAATGEPRRTSAQAGQLASQDTALPQNPLQKLMRAAGYGDDYDKSDVTKAVSWFSEHLDKGADWIEKNTNGALLKEDVSSLTNVLMLGLLNLRKGGIMKPEAKSLEAARRGPAGEENRASYYTPAPEVAEATAAVTKPRLKGPPAIMQPVQPEQGAFQIGTSEQPKPGAEFKATGEWQEVPKGTALEPGLEIRMDMESGKNYARVNPAKATYENLPGGTEPVAGHWEGPRGEFEETTTKPGLGERAIALARDDRRWYARLPKDQSGKADPQLVASIAAAGGFAAWAALNPEKAKEIGLGGLLVAGAVKGKGGMWHPESVERLARERLHAEGVKRTIAGKERGSVDPKLLARMATLGAGAVAGAYADKDNPVIGAIIGGIGASIATRAGRAALDRWKASPAEARAATWLSNKLYTLSKQNQVRQLQALAFLQKVVPPDYKFHAESIYHSMEDSKVKLSARARELKEALVRPLQAANAKLRSSLEALGVDVGPEIEQNYVHRIVRGQRSSVFEELEKSYPIGRNLPKTAPSLKEREAYAMETPTGNREIITMEPGNKFFVHRNGKVVGRGSIKGGEIKWGGQDWKRVQATTSEIETHTSLRYYKDAVGTELDNNIRLSAALRNAEFLNKLKSMPSFSDVAVNVKSSHAPADWRTVDIDQLKGYKFAPRVANALDDFKGEMSKHPAETLGKISRILTGSMFWNPLPHIWNVLDHAIVQRGLSAWVSPQGYTRLWKTVGPAWKSVVTQDANYLKFMHEGAGLMYPNVILRDFSEKVMQQLGQAPEMGAVAKAFGYANPAEMVRRIYALSRKTLWAGNDVIMMQAYFEKQLQGASVQGAIRSIEKHIPNYRIPDRVLGSRIISQVLQSPFFTAFGRYDYGRLASYGAMIKDAVSKSSSLGTRAKALDQMSMLAVMGLVVYPIVLDKVAQAITGDPKAKAGRFGASTVPYLLYEYFHQRQDLNQVVRSTMPIGPMLNAALEMYTNRDTFTGGKLFKSGQDAFSFISKQVSPLYTATRVQEGKVTPKEAAWQAVGVRFPKSAEDLKRARQQKALDKALRGVGAGR